MFDVANPQQRERLLVVAASIFLCVIVAWLLPTMTRETTRLKNERLKLQKDIEVLELHAKNKDEIESRLTAFTNQSLASSGSVAQSGYQSWLDNLAESVGFKNYESPALGVTNLKDAGRKYAFTVKGTGRLDQIAEFLRRFHRTDYLHLVQNVSPRPSTRNPGEFDVTIKIEALALPQVRTVNIPSNSGEVTAATDEETKMLAAIRERSILSAYQPPRQSASVVAPVPIPPPPDFDDTYYCVVNAIVEIDGRPQCWIDYRTEGKKFYLFEGESFRLGEVNCTVKKIEMEANRVQIAAAGGLYAVRLGKSIGQADESCYFFTGFVDAEGTDWTPESTGEPHCVIVYDPDGGNRRNLGVRHVLSEGDSFQMAEVLCTVISITPETKRVQIEAAGVVYDLRIGYSFSEFSNE